MSVRMPRIPHKRVPGFLFFVGILLVGIGLFLFLDDYVWHTIAYYGPFVGNTIIDDVLLEHGFYGIILMIIGYLVIMINPQRR